VRTTVAVTNGIRSATRASNRWTRSPLIMALLA
jgi:hypothetical protein